MLKVGALHIIRLFLAYIDAMNLRLNFHSGAIIGSFSISWCGHLIHVAIAISRGYIAFLKPISNGFNSFYSAKWLFTSHLLTFLGGLNSKTLSTYLTDLAHQWANSYGICSSLLNTLPNSCMSTNIQLPLNYHTGLLVMQYWWIINSFLKSGSNTKWLVWT